MFIKKRLEKRQNQNNGDTINKSTATSSMDRQANIVQNLIKEGAFDIAKDFIDFIKAKKEEKAEEKS
jgi:hypothetical protein